VRGDSSFALLLEAQARGHRVAYYTPDRLALRQNEVFATVRSLTVRDTEGSHFSLGDEKRVDLKSFDVILMRQDPPFDMNYIDSTFFLEKVHPKTLVVNDPVSVRNAPEKLFVTDFPSLQPPTLITNDRAAIAEFRRRHGDVVLKPLNGRGGSGVTRHLADDPNLEALLEIHAELSREPVILQKFLPSVTQGDKRILLIDGEPVPYALARMPQGDEFRGNLARGGKGVGVPLSERDRWIAAQVGPELVARGMRFVGLDVIGDWLTEVNVTSPTCIRELDAQFGLNIAGQLFDAIEAGPARLPGAASPR
jgi:glutathione synthase